MAKTQQQNHHQDDQQAQQERDRYSAYIVTDPKPGSARDKPFWFRVAPAFPHNDGTGFNLEIPQGIALSGRVVIRKDLPRDQADHAGE